MKLLIVTAIGIAACINGFLLFGCPDWFNPFVGILLNTAFPFVAAMTTIYGLEPKQ